MTQHTFVLSRRVGRDPGYAERALGCLQRSDYAGLTFRGSFERRSFVGPWGSVPPEREATAELWTGRRTPELVSVEVGPWARDVVEVRVRPVTRHPDRWRGPRQRRFFEHAHQAIDALARALEEETMARPARRPVARTA